MNSKISIIPFSKDHIVQTFDWLQDDELRHLFLLSEKPTIEKHKAYFEKVLNDSSQKVYAILFNDQHVGNCGFKNIIPDHSEGEIWIYIGDSLKRGKGIGKSATQRLLKEGLNNLSLKLIYLHVAEFNTAAIKLYKNLGFAEVSEDQLGEEWKKKEHQIIRMELKKD